MSPRLKETRETATQPREAAEAAVAKTLDEAAARIEGLAKRLNQCHPPAAAWPWRFGYRSALFAHRVVALWPHAH